MSTAREIESALSRYVGTTATTTAIARELSRLGKRYQTIQERWASEPMDAATTARVTAAEGRIEQAVRDLVESLPLPEDDGERLRWWVRFDGDPRGPVISLHASHDLPDRGQLDYRRIVIA